MAWTLEKRAAAAARMKTIHADPEFRARMKAIHADPEFKAAQAARMKARWGDPDFRSRQRAAASAFLTALNEARRQRGR